MLITQVLDDRGQASDLSRVAVQTLRGVESPGCVTLNLAQDPELFAAYLHLLGRLYLSAGRYFDAKDTFERARGLRIEVFGSSHPLVAETQNRLASTLRRLGDLAGAHSEIAAALATDEKYFGSESVPVAMDIAELAAILLQEGRVDDVQTHARQSVRILSSKTDPRRTIPMDLQARALQFCGRTDPAALQQAAELYVAILTIDGDSCAAERHPEYATHLHNQGTVLQSLGDLDAAAANYQKAIELWSATHGKVHPDVIDAMSNLGRVQKARAAACNGAERRELLEAARRTFADVLERDRELRGEKHPYVAYDLTSIASLVLLDPAATPADFAAARDHLVKAESIFRASDLPSHGYLANTLDALGQVLGRLGDPASEDKLKEAAAIRGLVAERCAACSQASKE